MKKTIWTIEKIKKGFESYYIEYGRYPTATEVDSYKKLPSSRQIQRNFGGLPMLRKQLGLKGQNDFTQGEHSHKRAFTIIKRAHDTKKEVHNYLIKAFGAPFVCPEYFFTDDSRCRTDFYVYYKGGVFSVDVFYPSDKRNLQGCLNAKMKINLHRTALNYPVIFLMMNPNIKEQEIQTIIMNKKNKLMPNQKVMTFEHLIEFCQGKKKEESI